MLLSVWSFLVRVIKSDVKRLCSSPTRSPGPLWRLRSPPPRIRLARLDERLRGSPIRDGWIARTHFADSCASLWLDGDLVPLEDLVLHDAHRDIHAPTRALIRAQAVLRARRRIAAADPGWALTPAGLAILRGRAGEGEGDPDTEPAPRDDGAGPWTTSLGAGDGISGNGFLAEGGPDELRRRLHRRRGRRRPHRAETWPAPRCGRKPATRWSTISTGTRMNVWPTGAPWSRQTAALPPVVAAALALDAWEQIAPLQHSPWLGRLLIPALLRGAREDQSPSRLPRRGAARPAAGPPPGG